MTAVGDDRLGDRRQQADGVGADPRSLDRRERVQADDPLGVGDAEDHERDGAVSTWRAATAKAGSRACADIAGTIRPPAGTVRAGHASRRHAQDPSCRFATRLVPARRGRHRRRCVRPPPAGRPFPEALNPGARDATRPAAASARRARAASRPRSTVTARSSAATACPRPWTPRPSPLARRAGGSGRLGRDPRQPVRGRVPEELRRPGGDLHVPRGRRRRWSSRRARRPSICSRIRSGPSGNPVRPGRLTAADRQVPSDGRRARCPSTRGRQPAGARNRLSGRDRFRRPRARMTA